MVRQFSPAASCRAEGLGPGLTITCCLVAAIVVQQTVQAVLLAGTNTIALACTTGTDGKTCTGAAQVPAIVEIDDGSEW